MKKHIVKIMTVIMAAALMACVSGCSGKKSSDKMTWKDWLLLPLILRLPQANTRNMFVAALDAINISIQDFNVFMERCRKGFQFL